jgi:hypothetical protein
MFFVAKRILLEAVTEIVNDSDSKESTGIPDIENFSKYSF